MFNIPSWQKTATTTSLDGEKRSMDAASAQISTALNKGRLALFLSGAVVAAGVVGVVNGVCGAQYASLASQVWAVVPEAAVSLIGGSGLVSHAVQNARLKNARKELKEDIKVNDAVRTIMARRP